MFSVCVETVLYHVKFQYGIELDGEIKIDDRGDQRIERYADRLVEDAPRFRQLIPHHPIHVRVDK